MQESHVSRKTPSVTAQGCVHLNQCHGRMLFIFGCALSMLTQSAQASVPDAADIMTPNIGDHQLHILSPTLLELVLVNTKQPDPGRVDGWDWVNDEQIFVPPDLSAISVLVDGQSNSISGVGFKRRAAYAPLLNWDLRIGNNLYLALRNPIPEGANIQVANNGTLWPVTLQFTGAASPLRYSPAIHVNQEGYLPTMPKKAMIGYYLGSLGEMAIPTNHFFILNTQTGAVVYDGVLSRRTDVGYNYTPTPYQQVYEADFSGYNSTGEYELVVPGMGASLPFRIDEGIAMSFARTHALQMYQQRSGTAVTMPFTRFTHGADHVSPAGIPTNDSAPFAFTWQTVANYCTEPNPDNPPQVAPVLTNYLNQLFPFVKQGTVSVSGGHFEAGDYNRVTYNGAQLLHLLLFAADSLPGVAALDNMGIPESGDGISDVLQEAKWEADFVAKMQDTDGGFYYSVYPQYREYEMDVLPENGDPQIVWPKNTATTAAAVAALAQCASSPQFRQAYPQAASNYWTKAVLGWQFLTNAIARFGFDGSYQKIQHFDDDFTHRDELAWAACELFLATGDPQYEAKLFEWYPDPTDYTTFHWGWRRMYGGFGNAARDYAFATLSGRLSVGQIDAGYAAKCVNVITNCGNDVLQWSQDNAYGSSFPDLTKAYRGGGWYFSTAQAFDLVVAYQFNPSPQYLDASLRNLNFEAGCNPVNACYVTGLGWKRQRNVVDQYSLNDRRRLPKDGVSASNIQAGFRSSWVYSWELQALSFPPDSADTAPYAYYDRWCDDWNVSTEGSTTDTARSFAVTAWLAARTSLATQPWRSTNANILGTATARLPGQPVTLSLLLPDVGQQPSRIVWEAYEQEPAFAGQSFTFTPGPDTGPYWIEAEAQWPDGRRAFAASTLLVSLNAQAVLTNPQFAPGTGFSFTLAGTPQATYLIEKSGDFRNWAPVLTNTLPSNGIAVITDSPPVSGVPRFYRAVRTF